MGIVEDYKNLVKKFKTGETIKSYSPSPNDTDYKRGYFYRFFVQKTNDHDAPIYEVNQKSFTRLSSVPDYITVSIRWRITGSLNPIFDELGNTLDFGVKESNRKSIELHKNKIPGLKYRLGNLLQFYRQ